jgi:CBS domain-containing protein
MKEASRCSYLLSISQAAALLASKQSGALIVTSDSGECIGLLTDELFRDVLSRRFWNPEQPVFEIMHSPVISIHPDTSLADAISLMDEKQSGYLVIKEQNGQIAGMIHYHDLAGILFQAYQMNRNIIPHLATGTQIKNLHDRTRRLIGLMINNHSRIDDITAAYSHFADRVTQEFASQIISELGSPPVPFAIIALGSEGRSEQTLMTDQDNALIYGSGILNDSDFIKNYFLQFGSRLNRLLDETGYHLCKGDVMARNPKWCQPLPVWQTYFNTWIQTPEPQAVLDISTFFDLRCVYGDHQLVLDLKQSIDNNLTHHPAFFSHMAIACMNYKIPIGLFKKIQTETDSEYANSINIKSPIRVIVHIIRLYAMFHRIGETNTLLRMKRLYDKNIFTPSIFNEWKDTYEFLMMLQLRHQSIAAEQRRPLTPYIHLSDITSVETDTLVSVFNRISLFQTALSRDFSIPK